MSKKLLKLISSLFVLTAVCSPAFSAEEVQEPTECSGENCPKVEQPQAFRMSFLSAADLDSTPSPLLSGEEPESENAQEGLGSVSVENISK